MAALLHIITHDGLDSKLKASELKKCEEIKGSPLADLILTIIVLLSGPHNAKAELMTMLKEDTQFEKIRLETKDSVKMSQNKQHDFVRDHFSPLQL